MKMQGSCKNKINFQEKNRRTAHLSLQNIFVSHAQPKEGGYLDIKISRNGRTFPEKKTEKYHTENTMSQKYGAFDVELGWVPFYPLSLLTAKIDGLTFLWTLWA